MSSAEFRESSRNSHFCLRTSYLRRLLDQKIAITDQQIDTLVYELYGLTEDETRIVEQERKDR